MTETPMKMYWKGEDVETLHRDVLMEIIRHLHKEVESTRSILRATIDIDRAAREAQRRLEPFPLSTRPKMKGQP